MKELTAFLVKYHLELQFGLALEALIDHGLFLLLSFRSVQKFAGATFLHDLRPRKSCQLAESIGAVDDRVNRRHLRISQHKVAVCNRNDDTDFISIIRTVIVYLYTCKQ